MEREFSIKPVITKDDNPEISMSVINLKGLNRYVVNPSNTAVYLCIKGCVTFALKEGEVFSLVKLKDGESIKILPNTPYIDFSENGVTLIAINKKAFDPTEVIELSMPSYFVELIKK